MKTTMRVLIFAFMVGMILGATEPALLYGGEGQGNPWDGFLDLKPYPGTKLEGPLSIYYAVTGATTVCDAEGKNCVEDNLATMYYTVRFKHGELYTFQGSKEGICLQNCIPAQVQAIKDFIRDVVVPGIFGDAFEGWKLKSIEEGQYNFNDTSMAFVAYIEITVKEKPKPKKHDGHSER
jgi:hypothetical protein